MLLPGFDSYADFDRAPRTLELYGPALKEVCRQQGLPFGRPRMFVEGSAVLAAVDERFVIKLFYPSDADHCAAERLVLAHLEQTPNLPTPGLKGWGVVQQWHYLVMELVAGTPLSALWNELSGEAQLAMMRQLARMARALHEVDPAGLKLPWPAFDQFAQQQLDNCLQHHRKTGLAEEWCRQIPDFVAQLGLTERPEASCRLLHTELMPAHVLVEDDDGGLVVSGVVDFEPAMIGHREYEWGAVAIFFAGGKPGLLGEFLRCYGYAPSELTPRLQAELLGYLLLHRYSHLPWYLELMPALAGSRLEDLAGSWFQF